MKLPGAKRLGDDRRPLGTLRCWRHSDIGPARGIVVTPALKEWSAAVHALLDGRQTVLLRKGGIGEKRFEVAAHEFLLFPTVAHSHAERVRPEHRDLLGSRSSGGYLLDEPPDMTPSFPRTGVSGHAGAVHSRCEGRGWLARGV